MYRRMPVVALVTAVAGLALVAPAAHAASAPRHSALPSTSVNHRCTVSFSQVSTKQYLGRGFVQMQAVSAPDDTHAYAVGSAYNISNDGVQGDHIGIFAAQHGKRHHWTQRTGFANGFTLNGADVRGVAASGPNNVWVVGRFPDDGVNHLSSPERPSRTTCRSSTSRSLTTSRLRASPRT
jgi:hypothetical protein